MQDPMITTAADPFCMPFTKKRRWQWIRRLLPIFMHPLYRAYEERLMFTIRSRPLPRHLGIILDGNRRHAQILGITDPGEVYHIGARKLDDVLDWCCELRIPTITLWVFSPDNLRRPLAERSGIFAAIQAKLTALTRDPRIHEARVRVRVIGKLGLIPEAAQAALRAAENATAGYDGMVLNIAVAYGGRQEIVDAVSAFLIDTAGPNVSLPEVIGQLTPETVGRYLYTAGLPDPDLIIRTSGEIRLSGFLLWQSAHSEFYFTDVHWPAFRKLDFLRAIRTYQLRQRRFGL
jgi:short-chain Z-isoprenyl diphosphate synthase